MNNKISEIIENVALRNYIYFAAKNTSTDMYGCVYDIYV